MPFYMFNDARANSPSPAAFFFFIIYRDYCLVFRLAAECPSICRSYVCQHFLSLQRQYSGNVIEYLLFLVKLATNIDIGVISSLLSQLSLKSQKMFFWRYIFLNVDTLVSSQIWSMDELNMLSIIIIRIKELCNVKFCGYLPLNFRIVDFRLRYICQNLLTKLHRFVE